MMDLTDFHKMLNGYITREKKSDAERYDLQRVIRWAGWVSYWVAPLKGRSKPPQSLLQLQGDKPIERISVKKRKQMFDRAVKDWEEFDKKVKEKKDAKRRKSVRNSGA